MAEIPGDFAPVTDFERLGVALKRVVNQRGRQAVEHVAQDLTAIVNGREPDEVRDAANRMLTAFNVDVGLAP